MSPREPVWSKILGLPGKVIKRSRQRGLLDVLGWSWYQVSWRWREWRLGLGTREFAHGVVVEDAGDCHGYEPIDYLCFDRVMEYFSPISEQDGFLDYGCGMGRAVLLAALQPYGRVLGVEIDPRLAAIARDEVSRFRRRGHARAGRIDILEHDASRYEVPAAINHVFLFNSFTGQLLEDVLERLRESVCRFPRTLWIAYLQPKNDSDPLSQHDWLRCEAELSTGYWMHVRSRIYRTDAALAEARRAEPAPTEATCGPAPAESNADV